LDFFQGSGVLGRFGLMKVDDSLLSILENSSISKGLEFGLEVLPVFPEVWFVGVSII